MPLSNKDKMEISRIAKGYPASHRPRSRERDQRMPTFQVLEKLHHNNPAEVKRIEPPPPVHHPGANQKRKSKSPNSTSPAPTTARRHSHHEAPKARNNPAATYHYYSPGKKSQGSDGSSGGNSRGSSVNSGRGPACSFANQFDQQRSKSYSPKRNSSPGRKSGEMNEEDEPTDVIVWDTARKASRSNILCPLTDSEFRGVSIEQKKTRIIKHYNMDENGKHVTKSCRFTQSSVAIPSDEPGRSETLDDQLPPLSPKEISSSVSIHSTSKHKIDLIGKQLDEIYNVQNDILNQLEASITTTQTENIELQNEISALRHNNKNLVYLLNDMSDELERMKHIFRNRGLPLPISFNKFSAPSPPTMESEKTQTPQSTAKSVGVQQRRSSGSREKASSPGRKNKRSRSREEEVTKSKPEAKPLTETEGRGETPLEISVIKDRKNREKWGKKQEHNNAVDPYHDEETDSSIFRNDSDNSVTDTVLSEGIGTMIVTSERSKKRSKEAKTGPSTSTKSSRDRKSRNSNKNNSSNFASDHDTDSTRTSGNSKRTTKPKSRGGCFGLFNLFRSTPAYARDSEDDFSTLK